MEKVVQVEERGAETPVMQPLVKDISGGKKEGKKNMILGLVAIVVILAGALAGWGLANLKKEGKIGGGSGSKTGAMLGKEVEKEAGADESLFSDEAEGILQEGDKNGEGTHYLDRSELGPNKDVALFSTVIDLQSYVGKKVQVWGSTVSSQKVGWLMEVGRIKVAE